MPEFTANQLAQYSFKFFFCRFLDYKWAPHFEEWQYLIENCPRFVLLCARGHGKTIFLIGYTLWLIYRRLPVDILFMSHSEEQVKLNIMNKLDEIIHTNDYLADLRPDVKQLWGAQLKTFKCGAVVRGESFGSSIRGAHPDYIFEDDPLKDKGGMTPEEQYNYHMTAITGMAKRGTVIGVIGTPLDNGDLLEQLENNPAYVCRKYPAENEERTKALFPELFTLEDLHRLEAECGSFAYSRERLLKRIDPKTQIFKDNFRSINDKQVFPEFPIVRTIIDPAISEKESACDSAIVTVGIDMRNEKWEIDTRLIKADDPRQILDECLMAVRANYARSMDYAVVMESEVFQKVLAFDLRKELIQKGFNIRVIEVAHSGIKGKHERIIGLQPDWEARNIHLLPNSPLIAQFRYYRPNIRGFKLDGLDAFSWIRHEDVAVPIFNAQAVNPGVPPDAWL